MKIAYALPKKVVSNSHLKNLGWDDEKIFQKTGIRRRHVCGKNETALDLAVRACEPIFKHYHVLKNSVNFLLYCTQSPDTVIPTNACVLQERLGLKTGAGALDFNLGCSGFVYGLSLAKGLLETGQASNLLLVTSDTYSKYLRPKDRATRALFGDGAAAILLKKKDAFRIGPFVFGTDGSGAGNLCVKNGFLYMNGPEILNFTLDQIPKAVSNLLTQMKCSINQIDHFVFHQANRFLLEALREKLGVPTEKFHIRLEETGNTVSSSIPIVLCDLEREGRIRRGQKILLAGFGVGYSWIVTVLNA